MFHKPLQAGINIDNDQIDLVIIQKTFKKYQLINYQQFNYHSAEQQLNTLAQIKAILPQRARLCMALSADSILQKPVSLPSSLCNQERQHYLYSLLPKLFNLSADALCYDFYPIDNGQLLVTAVHKNAITNWLNLFHRVKLKLSVIDIEPCVLRYLANFYTLPPKAYLLYYHSQKWLIVSPLSQPFSYQLLNHEQAIEFINNHFDNETQWVTNHSLPLTKKETIKSFKWKHWLSINSRLILPTHFNIQSIIALGLAIRGDDVYC